MAQQYWSPLLYQQKQLSWQKTPRQMYPTTMPTSTVTGIRPGGFETTFGAAAGLQPSRQTYGTITGTTGGTTEWLRPKAVMPKYKVPEKEIRKLAREHLSTAMRPMRRGLREALTQAQTAATGPMRAYMMRQALQGFSGGIGAAVQKAREYGRTLATEKARAQWEAAVQAWLREWKRKTTGTTEQVTTQAAAEYREPKIMPGVYSVGGPYKYYAQGGPVATRKPIVVGEEGPELFVPEQKGTILPNPMTQGMEGGLSPISQSLLSRPRVEQPTGPTNAGPMQNLQAPWYQNLLKQRRQQTPIRRLI